jgi:hypothetical protein
MQTSNMLKNLQKLLTFTVNACTRFNVVLTFIIVCKSSRPSLFFWENCSLRLLQWIEKSLYFLLPRLNISKQKFVWSY